MPDAVLLTIRRAQKHIDDLKAEILEFKNSRPYAIARKRDLDSGEWLLYVVAATPVPDAIPIILGDVVHNLYCTLDYLAWEIVNSSGIKTPTRSTAFPISRDVPTMKDQIERYERQVDGMPEDAKKAIRRMEPYRRADNFFWMLQKLNNINKHRTLLAVGFTTESVSGPVELMKKADIRYGSPLETGSVIASTPADVEGHFDTQFFFDVAVSEPEADCPAFPIVEATLAWSTLVWNAAQALATFR
jgi:hypothetical protein